MKHSVIRCLRAILVAASLGGFSLGWAQEVLPEGSEKLVEALRQAMPNIPIEAVTRTPLQDFYAIDLPGAQTLYGSADGKYLFSGDLHELGDSIVNLAEARRMARRRELLAAVPRQDMVIFSPLGETRDYVSVFTDVDCGYCRKLHQEMADINALGIEVRYLGYPRSGIDTPSYDKIVSAWCADDANKAMTALKRGADIPARDCENPIAAQFELGQLVGVTGTPAIVTSDGRLLPGYMPAASLAQALGLN